MPILLGKTYENFPIMGTDKFVNKVGIQGLGHQLNQWPIQNQWPNTQATEF
jgi:hypothetical protein